MKTDTIVIGCDNAAVDMKNVIVAFLEEKGMTVEDVGVKTADDDTYYPYVVQKVCEKIIESGYTKDGILICRDGYRHGDDSQ